VQPISRICGVDVNASVTTQRSQAGRDHIIPIRQYRTFAIIGTGLRKTLQITGTCIHITLPNLTHL
jgi:uncharacterized membrane-anchored protein